MTFASYTYGVYQAGDGQISIRGRQAKDDADRAVIVCHGRTPAAAAGQACLQFAPAAGGGPPHLMYLAERGYGFLVIDAAGNTTWGNDASITAVTNAVNWVKGAWADPTKKVAILGYSMGLCVALNYITRNPSQVCGLVGEAPAVDISWFYANSGFTAEIDAAYGGSWTTNGTGHDPMRDFVSSITTPTRLYSAVDDATAPNSQAHQLYSALGSSDKRITDLPSGGHSSFWGFIDQQGLGNWLDSLAW